MYQFIKTKQKVIEKFLYLCCLHDTNNIYCYARL